jgi:hypothetical protein
MNLLHAAQLDCPASVDGLSMTNVAVSQPVTVYEEFEGDDLLQIVYMAVVSYATIWILDIRIAVRVPSKHRTYPHPENEACYGLIPAVTSVALRRSDFSGSHDNSAGEA